jgi:hypothetical protein
MPLHPKIQRLGVHPFSHADIIFDTTKSILAANKQDAIAYAQEVGLDRVQDLLQSGVEDLQKRLDAKLRHTDRDERFTVTQMRTAIAQLKDTLLWMVPEMSGIVEEVGGEAAQTSALDTIDYLGRMDEWMQKNAGVTTPLAIREARVMDSAVEGAHSSILHSLSQRGTDEEPSPAKMGVLQRYGVETIDHFEGEMRRGLIAQKTWAEMESDLVDNSPFLQGKPAHWAKRIVRTEVMGAYARSSWEAIREVDEQLGDMVKILVATFDDRTGSDSYAVHGQCRRPEEAFLSWYGYYQHPPNRPNDREIVVPHRISWPISPMMVPVPISSTLARWKLEGHKKPMPPIPLITTVPFNRFGKVAPPKLKRPDEDEDEDGEAE